MSKGGGTAIGRAHEKIGVMACVVCAREIPVKKTGSGKLSIACTWCDLPLYVNPHSEAFALVMKRVKLDSAPANDAPDPPAASPAAAPAEPEPKKDPPARRGPLFGSRA